jgi:hypothetical protein
MSWFVYVIRFAGGLDRDSLARRLEARSIPVRPYFLPIHLQPYMVERFGYREGDFPVTEDLGRRGLALPFSGVMTEEQVEIVCRVLEQEMKGPSGNDRFSSAPATDAADQPGRGVIHLGDRMTMLGSRNRSA